MNSWLSNVWQKLQASFWLVPALMALLSVGLATASTAVDNAVGDWLAESGWFWGGEPAGAREMLTTIAGSMITVTGVTFSIVMVALTLAASQFGPRLLRSFMRDRGNQVVLGTFVSTFLFCLLVLRVVRDGGPDLFVPHLSITIALALALASIGVLIYFIHHVAVSLQAENLAAAIAVEFRGIVRSVFPQELSDAPPESASGAELPADFDQRSRSVPAPHSGYIQTVQTESLVALARERDLVLQLHCSPGGFAIPGQVLLRAWPTERCDDRLLDELADKFVIGRHRTPTQDASYPMNQLGSIAVRALSPGINDPFTAHTCIDWLSEGLAEVSRRHIPSPFMFDSEGGLRLVAPPTTFEHLAAVAFDQIRDFGADHASVVRRLLESIAAVACSAVREDDRRVLERHADWILEAARRATHQPHQLREIEQLHQRALAVLHPRAATGGLAPVSTATRPAQKP